MSNTDKYVDYAEAFQIFSKYSDPDENVDHVSAGSYEIYAGPDPDLVNEKDIERLEELGWRVNNTYECFCKFF